MRLLKHPRLIRQEPFSYTAMASLHGHLSQAKPRAVRPVLPTTTRVCTDGRGAGTSCTHGQARRHSSGKVWGIITTNSASDSFTTGQWPSHYSRGKDRRALSQPTPHQTPSPQVRGPPTSAFPIGMLPKLGCHRRKTAKPGPSLRKVCHAVLSRFSISDSL